MTDRGVQVERTRLAWRRTVLALAVGSLVGIRVLAGLLGGLAVAAGAGGILLAVLIWSAAERRGARAAEALRSPGAPGPGAAALALLAAMTSAGAALGLAWLVLH